MNTTNFPRIVNVCALEAVIANWRAEAEQLKSSYAYPQKDGTLMWEQEAPCRKFETLIENANQIEALIFPGPRHTFSVEASQLGWAPGEVNNLFEYNGLVWEFKANLETGGKHNEIYGWEYTSAGNILNVWND